MAEAGIGTALIFTALGMRDSRQQEKLDVARIGYEQESAQLAAAESAYESTRNFNQAVGTQIALAGARGGGSMLQQFSVESYANYLADQNSIRRRGENAVISGSLSRGQAYGDRRLRDLQLLSSFGQNVGNTYNLNASSKSATKIGGKM
jgi:hypothetical protein